MPAYEDLRLRHRTDALGRIAEFRERLGWPAARLAAERERALRRLVALARERSPFHARRLAHLDPDTLTEAHLADVAPMGKDDLMASFDEIVTDPRLRRATVERHLATLERDAYLLDEFHVVCSGGSSGRRGVFVYDWEGWQVCFLAYLRRAVEVFARVFDLSRGMPVVASVAAAHATHMTSAVGQTFLEQDGGNASFPVTLSTAEIVAGLNRIRPDALAGYPTALFTLAHEARAGRLDVAPRVVLPSSEPLLPEIRDALVKTWHPTIVNVWGTSEACITAMGCGLGDGMHLTDDLVIVEPVDAAGRPVAPGVRSAKLHLTNLFNLAMPLIRYEITDEVVLLDAPCPCGSAHRRIADIHGRLDDAFHYAGGRTVHPHVFRSILGRDARIVEYQVRQTTRGAAVAVRTTGPVDAAALATRLAGELSRLGLTAPEVDVATVVEFERTAVGKLKRFVPLPPE